MICKSDTRLGPQRHIISLFMRKHTYQKEYSSQIFQFFQETFYQLVEDFGFQYKQQKFVMQIPTVQNQNNISSEGYRFRYFAILQRVTRSTPHSHIFAEVVPPMLTFHTQYYLQCQTLIVQTLFIFLIVHVRYSSKLILNFIIYIKIYSLTQKMSNIRRIFPQNGPKAIGPYSPVVCIQNLVFVSGQVPLSPETNNVQAKDIEGQTTQVMENLKNALKSAFCNFQDVVKTTILLTDMNNFAKVNQIYGSYFGSKEYPARITYAVSGLPKGSLVQIDAIAIKNLKKQKQVDIIDEKIKRIFPRDGPFAIGPYSPVTTVNGFVFVSGQIPIDPKTNCIDAKDIEGQTKQVMQNLKNALKSVECSFSQVTKTTILLTDMNNFGKVNEIYSSYFGENRYPARVTYAVSGLPKGSLVQIDAIAYKDKEELNIDKLSKKIKIER